MSKGFASNYRIVLLATGIFASFGVLGSRLVYLHVVNRGELLKSVAKVRRKIRREPAMRGEILDARGLKLATNRPVVDLGVDPQAVLETDSDKWAALAALIGRPLAEVETIIQTKTRKAEDRNAGGPTAPERGEASMAITLPSQKAEEAAARSAGITDEKSDDETVLDDSADKNGNRPILWAPLADGIDQATYDRIVALKIKGVYGNLSYRRYYPQDALAAHLVGYVNKANQPAAGIEYYANFYLSGQDGWSEGERDGRGREAAQFRTREVKAGNGFSVVLSIDSVIQDMVEKELAAIERDFHPQGATIIVSDARTGFLLALGNSPTFNLNAYNLVPRSEQARLKNIAVTNQLDPGSTFKIVAASGALNENLVRPEDRFDCTLATIDYEGHVRHFMADDHVFDHRLSVAEIISHSSNIGAAQLGMRLGEQRLYDYARAFGFGEPTGFPFGGEISGLLKQPDRWTADDITRIPAGYSVSATPMQIHYAMSVIASGGLLLQPQVIREIRDPSGEVSARFDTVVKRRVISQSTAATMATMLMGVVSSEGTAPVAAIPGFQVAGKTGTAQKLINGRYSDTNHVGSFVGFFPASNPRVVITVIVDDGKVAGGQAAYGRIVAAPSFNRLGRQLIQVLDIKPVGGAPASAGRMLALEGGRR